MIPEFSYIRAKSLRDALPHLAGDGARIHAGGTDLLGCMRDNIFGVKSVVSISGLNDLKGIRKTAEGLRIGALVTLTEIAESPDINKFYPALAQGAASAASPQLRNQGAWRQSLSEAALLVLSWRIPLPQKRRGPLLCGRGRESLPLHPGRTGMLHCSPF